MKLTRTQKLVKIFQVSTFFVEIVLYNHLLLQFYEEFRRNIRLQNMLNLLIILVVPEGMEAITYKLGELMINRILNKQHFRLIVRLGSAI